MYITDPEYDFWPWTWYHDQKECKSIEDLIIAWKTIEPGNDPVFDPRRHQHRNSAGQKKITDIVNKKLLFNNFLFTILTNKVLFYL